MPILKHDEWPVRSEQDVVRARQMARQWAMDLGFSLVDQTKIVTAVSELARNTLVHGRGGSMRLEVLSEGGRKGLRAILHDSGPGIPDVEAALKDGFTTGGGLGLGLGGAKRLMNEFALESRPGEGTTVSVVRWK